MSVAGQMNQLQQDLKNELITANQLLQLISMELQKIKIRVDQCCAVPKSCPCPKNASIMAKLASIQKIDLENVPQMKRQENVDITQNTNPNMSYKQHDTFRHSMDESQ